MSFDRSVRYPTKWLPPTGSFPFGVPKNSTTETSKDGSPFEKDWISDTEGFFQGLLSRANITLSGNPDTVLISDYLDGLDNHINRIASRSFLDVASLILEENIASKMMLYVRDYYNDKRGGSGFYLVKTTAEKNADGDDIDEKGNFTSAVSGLFLILQDITPITIENFGARFDEDSSVSIRAAITSRKFKPTIIPAKRYIYDGVVITDDICVLVGEKMPTVKTGFTGLENGSILEGTFSITSKTAWLTDFGVDLGTDTAAAAGDGIKCTTALDAGIHLHVENLIAVGKTSTDDFHSLLFESYQKLTGGNIEGINNDFSCVIKCQNVNLSSVYGQNSSRRGLYLKSDNVNGKCGDVNIANLIVDGNGNAGQGLYLEAAATADLEHINIQNAIIKGYAAPVEAIVSGAGTKIKHVNIGNLIIENPTASGLLVNAPSEVLEDFKVGKLTITEAEAEEVVRVRGGVNHFQLGMVHIDYKVGTLDAVIENAVNIEVDVLKTQIGFITITRDGSALDADLGFINYENNKVNNILGPRVCKIKGVGVPETGVSVFSGSGATITLNPVDNVMSKDITLTTETGASSTATVINNERYTGVKFETGTKLTIINNSPGFTFTIAHDPGSGNIRNKGSVSVVLGSNDAVQYILNKDGVWTEV